MGRFFAGSFKNAQLASVVGQIADGVGGRVLGDRVGQKIGSSRILVDLGETD